MMDGRTIGRDISKRKELCPGQVTAYKMSQLKRMGIEGAEETEFLKWVNSMDSINYTITQGLLLLYKIEKQVLQDKANKAKELASVTVVTETEEELSKSEMTEPKKTAKKPKTLQSILTGYQEAPHVSADHSKQFIDLYNEDEDGIQVLEPNESASEQFEISPGNVIDLNEIDLQLLQNTFESVKRKQK